MIKDNNEQVIYNVNKYYFRLHNKGCSINEQMDFIYYTEQKIWYVYGEDFNGKKIDIAILNNKQVKEIKSWLLITKKKLIEFLSFNKTPASNKQNIFYRNEIIEYYCKELLRDQKINEILKDDMV